MERKETFVSGDVVYFVDGDRVNYGIYDCHIDEWGYSYVDMVETYDHRYVNGIPIQEFESEKDWKSLPKGWTYNTELYKIEWKVPEKKQKLAKILRIDRPEDIKTGLREGVLDFSRNIFHGAIDVEIQKYKGYRIVKKYPLLVHGHTDHQRIRDNELFRTWEEAKKRLEEKLEKERAIRSMSDEEWSWNEIMKILERVKDTDYRRKCLNFIEGLTDIWDVETKLVDGFVYWRWFTPKTIWKPIGKEEGE